MRPIRDQSDVDEGLKQLLEVAPNLSPIAQQCGQLPLRLHPGGFPGLARIVIGQQVSVASAAAIHGRFVEHVRPCTPESFMKAGEKAWISIGLSRPKQRTLAAVCEALMSGSVDLNILAQTDADDAMSVLTSIKGVGPWTAEVYLLFCCGHPDIFPAGDLALQESVKLAFDLQARPSDKHLRALAENWAPYKGIAARLFWAYYSITNSQKESLPV